MPRRRVGDFTPKYCVVCGEMHAPIVRSQFIFDAVVEFPETRQCPNIERTPFEEPSDAA